MCCSRDRKLNYTTKFRAVFRVLEGRVAQSGTDHPYSIRDVNFRPEDRHVQRETPSHRCLMFRKKMRVRCRVKRGG
jgi:hypothetical protein